jgi:hypothetical protein
LLERGYYENLTAVERFNSQLWEIYSQRPVNWLDNQIIAVARPTGDFLRRELVPSASFFSGGSTVTTNRWGMRDREYEQRHDPKTYRIALLGPSFTMGQGVNNDESFEAILERRMNNELGKEPYSSYEILNFGVSGYRPIQQVFLLEQKVFTFAPNAVFYTAYGGEANGSILHLAETIQNQVPVPFDFVNQILRASGVEKDMPHSELLRRLQPYRDEIQQWVYSQMVSSCRRNQVVPVWVYVPMPGQEHDEVSESQKRMARTAGFEIVDLSHWFDGQDLASVSLAHWDRHPNVLGHRLIAAQLFGTLQNERDKFFQNGAP